MLRSAPVVLGLAAILAAGALLRLRGNDYLLPLLVEPDVHIAIQVSMMEQGIPEPATDINYGSYPHLIALATVATSSPPARAVPAWKTVAPFAAAASRAAILPPFSGVPG